MQPEVLHRSFMEALEKRIPNKSKLVDKLTDILCMEKGAVNRRLRGEVPFSFYEAVNIAENLKITISHFLTAKSLWIDNIAQDMAGLDYKIWEEIVDFVKLAKNDPNSHFTDSSNLIPGTIFYKYPLLYKFYLYKYQYLLKGTEDRMSFNDFKVPEYILDMSHTYFLETKHFDKTTYICDQAMINNLITDVHYFSSINLISIDDIQQIKAVLFDLVDYFESIALNGCFEESGKPADIYISDINLDTNYNYLRINDIYISYIRTFCIHTIMSRDKITYDKIRKWVQSLIKTSTLISRSAAVFRAEFFEKQHIMISEL